MIESAIYSKYFARYLWLHYGLPLMNTLIICMIVTLVVYLFMKLWKVEI
jgi:hypothetical protein